MSKQELLVNEELRDKIEAALNKVIPNGFEEIDDVWDVVIPLLGDEWDSNEAWEMSPLNLDFSDEQGVCVSVPNTNIELCHNPVAMFWDVYIDIPEPNNNDGICKHENFKEVGYLNSCKNAGCDVHTGKHYGCGSQYKVYCADCGELLFDSADYDYEEVDDHDPRYV